MTVATPTQALTREPGLQRALDVWRSESARAALLRLLAQRSNDGVLARGGRLMSRGYPVELTFTTASPDTARYTADIVHPSVPPAQRLAGVVGSLSGLGVEVPGSTVLEALSAAQRGADLAFGAWLGGRHDVTGDRFKLYVEVPRQAHAATGSALAAELRRERRLLDTATLRFVGIDLPSQTVELYYRVGPLDRAGLQSVLAAEGLGQRAVDLIDTVGTAADWPVSQGLPGANWCVSVTIGSPDRRGVSLFAHTPTLLGRDRVCRDRLRRLVAGRRQRLGAYDEVSAPLKATDQRLRHHSMATFSVSSDEPVHVGIGLRPPD